MSDLAGKSCVPCRGGEPPLGEEEIRRKLGEVPDWELVRDGGVPRLRRSYKFRNFARALSFTDAVGAAAEEQGHHPRITTEWGRVTLEWWTHKIDGLHENDFIMAARSDALYAKR